jgi:hypothetical protein
MAFDAGLSYFTNPLKHELDTGRRQRASLLTTVKQYTWAIMFDWLWN